MPAPNLRARKKIVPDTRSAEVIARDKEDLECAELIVNYVKAIEKRVEFLELCNQDLQRQVDSLRTQLEMKGILDLP